MIDSNLAIWLVAPTFAPIDVSGQFAAWTGPNTRLVVPDLWLAECISVIRKGVHQRRITNDEARASITELLALDIDIRPITIQNSWSAYEWAGRLGQARAYDSYYLALAEELGAEFWTADRRLFNAAQREGAIWAHWIGDAVGAED